MSNPSRPNKKLRKQQQQQKSKPKETPQQQHQQQQQPKSKKSRDTQKSNQMSKDVQFDVSSIRKEVQKHQIIQLEPREDRVPLFQHIPSYQVPESLTQKIRFGDKIHPAILRVGLKTHKMKITGSNSRTIALLEALISLLEDYTFPPDVKFHEHLFQIVNTQIQFIIDCRPMSVGMRNAVKQFKFAIRKTRNMDEKQIIDNLIDFLRGFIHRNIVAAGNSICDLVLQKINNGDVIITFGSSSTVERVFKRAQEEGIDFRVIIVDSNPRYEGKLFLKKLNALGIDCTYCLLSGLSYVMSEGTKVLLGASAMLSNGAAMCRVGTALVAMMANAQNIPVLFVCETYKFHDKVQLDSICFNELNDPSEVINDERAPSDSKKHLPKLQNARTLNIEIDVTPAVFISAIVTELGMIPPTSVPAVIRGQREHQTI